MIIEKSKMFVIYDMHDESLVFTLSFWAKGARGELTGAYDCTWKEAYKLGYRCRKVEVTIKTI